MMGIHRYSELPHVLLFFPVTMSAGKDKQVPIGSVAEIRHPDDVKSHYMVDIHGQHVMYVRSMQEADKMARLLCAKIHWGIHAIDPSGLYKKEKH